MSITDTKQYFNYTIIDFEQLIERIDVSVINYYFENNIELKKIDKDFKKIFINFFIKHLCDKCLEIKNSNKKILFCNPNIVTPKSEIFDYIDYQQFIVFINSILKEIESILPILVYVSNDITYTNVQENSTLNDIKFNFDFLYGKKDETKSLRKLMKYAESLGLNFLHKSFLNQQKIHKIFI